MELVEFISGVGFPITCCICLFKIQIKQTSVMNEMLISQRLIQKDLEEMKGYKRNE